MSNQKEQMQRELNHLRSAMESIEESFSTGVTDENGDLLIPENQVTLIKLILSEG